MLTTSKKKLWGNHLWSLSYCVVRCGGAAFCSQATFLVPSPRASQPTHQHHINSFFKIGT